jgi:hypothetical protein
MAVKARVSCFLITDYGVQKEVVLRPVTAGQEDDPNKSFSKWTPAGELKLTITNPEAFNQFVVGKLYDVDVTEYEAEAAA